MTTCQRILCWTILGSAFAASQASQAANPEKRGPYQVGVRTEVFVDTNRECAITDGPRTLVTEIWYPSTSEATTAPENKFADFWLRPAGVAAGHLVIAGFGGDFQQTNSTFQNFARRGAPLQDGAFPLLIFSHGNGGFRHQNTWQAEYLASHGYIVAAPDHTGNAAVSVQPERVVPYNAVTRSPDRRDDRPLDVSFLISHLEGLSASADHWLSGGLVPDQVGLFGHSFGGFTVCRAIELDERIRAIMPMTLAGTRVFDAGGDAAQACSVPLMVILGDADRTVGERGNERSIRYFERATGPRFLLNFKDAGHYTFTEMPQINPDWGDGIGVERDDDGNVTLTFSDAVADQRVTNACSAAFFDAFLKKDAAARSFLNTERFPDELEYRRE